MADWSQLKPLRLHRNMMTIVIIVLGIILLYMPSKKQAATTPNQEIILSTAIVISKSGLKIRQEPNLNSSVLSTVPCNMSLNIIDKNGTTDNVDGKTGMWYKVDYEGITGYAWSNFIKE